MFRVCWNNKYYLFIYLFLLLGKGFKAIWLTFDTPYSIVVSPFCRDPRGRDRTGVSIDSHTCIGILTIKNFKNIK